MGQKLENFCKFVDACACAAASSSSSSSSSSFFCFFFSQFLLQHDIRSHEWKKKKKKKKIKPKLARSFVCCVFDPCPFFRTLSIARPAGTVAALAALQQSQTTQVQQEPHAFSASRPYVLSFPPTDFPTFLFFLPTYHKMLTQGLEAENKCGTILTYLPTYQVSIWP